MATRREKIIAKAIEILKSNPDGIRYSGLVRKISKEFPEILVMLVFLGMKPMAQPGIP